MALNLWRINSRACLVIPTSGTRLTCGDPVPAILYQISKADPFDSPPINQYFTHFYF